MDLLKNLFKGDKVVWVIFLCLCLISIVEVFSASSTLIYKTGNHWDPITRHSTFLIAGAILVILFHNIKYKWFQVLPLFLFLVSIPFLVLLLLFDNLNIAGMLVIEKTNNAGRWVQLFGIQFQPSELAKMATIIFTAFTLSRKQDENGASPKAFKNIMWIAGITCALILPENYSTGILLAGTVYLMMFIGRIRSKNLLLLGGSVLTAATLFVCFLFVTPNDVLEKIPMGHRFTTVKSRIQDFVHKEHVPAAKFDVDGDAQIAHARIAVASSDFIGKGPGNSVERDFLSQAFSDFIYAIIIEELGLGGGIFVVFLYICLLMRAGRIAKKCDRAFPAFLVLGISLLLVIQALFNMMVAVGLAPVTGQPLPIISRGGTSTLINCIYIGMILSVSRYASQIEEQAKAESAPLAPVVEAQASGEPVSEPFNNDEKLE